MEITRYTFQSPYPSQIQVGKPDTSAKQGDTGGLKNMNESLRNAQNFQATQKQEVTPTVDSKSALDLYV